MDEAMLTGESRLVAKTPGSSVTGGTVNYEGPISVKATSTGKESTLAGGQRAITRWVQCGPYRDTATWHARRRLLACKLPSCAARD